MVAGLIFFLLVFTFILIKSADLIVLSLRRLSTGTPAKVFIFSSIIVAMATSFPELSVGVISALEGTPHLSFGNVLGANIANISLVAGLAAFIIGKVIVHGKFIRQEVAVALVAGILPLILAADGVLSRADGIMLLIAYIAYTTSFFKLRFVQIAEELKEKTFFYRFYRHVIHTQISVSKTKEIGRLLAGMAILTVSADILVKIAERLAEAAEVPIFLIGLILVSIGTTLPEVAFSLRSLKDKEPMMFFGNLLGSIIANSTLILGLASLIYPIQITMDEKTWVAAFTFPLVFLLFWFFIKTKLRLERWEAGLLLLVYIAFVVLEFAR